MKNNYIKALKSSFSILNCLGYAIGTLLAGLLKHELMTLSTPLIVLEVVLIGIFVVNPLIEMFKNRKIKNK